MLTVKVTHSFSGLPLERQLPTGEHLWDGCRFLVNTPDRECDAWMILHDLPEPQTVRVPPQHTALYLFEYPEIQPRIHPAFLRQFPTVFSFGRDFPHRRRIEMVSCFPWMFGMEFQNGRIGKTMSFSELERTEYRNKPKKLSVISSNKCQTRGHRRRLAFVRALKAHFGDRIDVFGRGIRDCVDKREAIAPYAYHIALENSVCRDGPSEKLYDAFLGTSFPLYYGCPNIYDFFPRESLQPIDIDRPHEAIRIIEQTMHEHAFERHFEAILEGKRRVLNQYNIFARLAGFCRDLYPEGPPEMERDNLSRADVSLLPERHFPWPLRARVKKRLDGLCHRAHGILHGLGY